MSAEKETKSETVTITVKEYNDLLDSALKLDALEAGGVDNWSGYDDSLEEYREAKREAKQSRSK